LVLKVSIILLFLVLGIKVFCFTVYRKKIKPVTILQVVVGSQNEKMMSFVDIRTCFDSRECFVWLWII